MKPTKSILILLSLFLISNCGDKVREEIVERYDNGQIREEKNYKDGKKSGKWIWYYENGEIKFENNYKNGILNETNQIHTYPTFFITHF